MDFPERSIDDVREHSQEDGRFLEKVESSITLIDGHYYIDLPLKKIDVKFPRNESQALGRLHGLKAKMSCNTKFSEDYKNFMSNILEKGYAERVPEEDLQRNDGRVWYIPHHGVYHPKKPEKVRVVFDCTASYNGVSLNNSLLQGPNLTCNLIGVLLRFRQEKIAILSDVESMFYQVRVPRKDCDCLRFFWWPDGDLQAKLVAYRMLVHLFGAVSSPSCASAALQQTTEDNEIEFGKTTANVIRKNHVDDCLTSVETPEKAVILVRDLTNLCERGGFHLTKWMSNDHTVVESVPAEERAQEVRHISLDSEPLPSERALGVHWSAESDSLGFSIKVKDQMPTRRNILSIASSTYDPLGLAAPYILTTKVILQNLCRQGVGWDQEVAGTTLRAWLLWHAELPLLANLQLPRCYQPRDFGELTSYQMHVFSDASDVGYGVATYLRLTDDRGQRHCSLLMGKARVAPLKKLTTPRMELTGATVAVRIAKMLLMEIDYGVNEVVYWTDSMSVLRYISNETSRFHTFVANRLTVIREASDPQQWRYVDSGRNPANCASRGMPMEKLLQNIAWLNGPEFLWLPDAEWPQPLLISKDLDVEDPEVKKIVHTAITDQSSHTMDRFIDHHSNWHKLKKCVGWILVAMSNLRRRSQQRKTCIRQIQEVEPDPIIQTKLVEEKILALRKEESRDIRNGLSRAHLTHETYLEAERVLILYVQKQHFTEEMHILGNVQSCEHQIKGSSKLHKLNPIMVDGLLRVGGRLDRASIPYDAKHQVILPKDSQLSELILREVHNSVGHLGKNAMLNVVRQRYWII